MLKIFGRNTGKGEKGQLANTHSNKGPITKSLSCIWGWGMTRVDSRTLREPYNRISRSITLFQMKDVDAIDIRKQTWAHSSLSSLSSCWTRCLLTPPTTPVAQGSS